MQNVNGTKKFLMVIAFNGFRDVEYFKPKQILQDAGLEIITASLQTGLAQGADGGTTQVEMLVKDVNVEDFDGVAFIGGPGMVELLDTADFQDLAQQFYQAGKLTSAICVAPGILAKAGILKGKNATSWSGALSILKENGANVQNLDVVIDGNIITANGPAAAESFGKAILNYLFN